MSETHNLVMSACPVPTYLDCTAWETVLLQVVYCNDIIELVSNINRGGGGLILFEGRRTIRYYILGATYDRE